MVKEEGAHGGVMVKEEGARGGVVMKEEGGESAPPTTGEITDFGDISAEDLEVFDDMDVN